LTTQSPSELKELSIPNVEVRRAGGPMRIPIRQNMQINNREKIDKEASQV